MSPSHQDNINAWARGPAMTEVQAREAVSLLPGINVRKHKGTWQFESRFHTTDGWHRRYAGKDLERAIALRAELITAHAKRLPVQMLKE